MKSTFLLATTAALVCWTSALLAQVTVQTAPAPALAPGNNLDPVPATPVVPTPNGERRAIRREDRRIDRTNPNSNLQPTVEPNGTVTATPNNSNAVAPRTTYYRAPNQTYGRTYRRGMFGRRIYTY